MLFKYFHETNINQLFLGVTQIQELHVSFDSINFLNYKIKTVAKI